jgi:hypothetical protein
MNNPAVVLPDGMKGIGAIFTAAVKEPAGTGWT